MYNSMFECQVNMVRRLTSMLFTESNGLNIGVYFLLKDFDNECAKCEFLSGCSVAKGLNIVDKER